MRVTVCEMNRVRDRGGYVQILAAHNGLVIEAGVPVRLRGAAGACGEGAGKTGVNGDTLKSNSGCPILQPPITIRRGPRSDVGLKQ
jgi:hypothetical protein